MLGSGLGVAIGAALVFVGGSRLVPYAQEISAKTGLGESFVGVSLLAWATALPDLVIVGSAAAIGAADLAVGQVFGAIGAGLVVLAVSDAAGGESPVTCRAKGTGLVQQGLLLTFLVVLGLVAVLTGEPASINGIGAGSLSIAVLYLVGLRALYALDRDEEPAFPGREFEPEEKALRRRALLSTLMSFSLASLLVLIGGLSTTISAALIAEATGVSGMFIGFTLLALVATLPEMVTVTSAVRIGACGLAVGDVLGGRLMNLFILLPADLLFGRGPLLRAASGSAVPAAALALVLVMIVLVGLVVRSRRALFGLGYDSVVILLVYFVGLFAIFRLS